MNNKNNGYIKSRKSKPYCLNNIKTQKNIQNDLYSIAVMPYQNIRAMKLILLVCIFLLTLTFANAYIHRSNGKIPKFEEHTSKST